MNPFAYQEYKDNLKLSEFGFRSSDFVYDIPRLNREKEGDKNMKKMKVEESKKLADGLYRGKIDDIKYRDEPYEYTDLVIVMDDGFKLSVGYPSKVTQDSALGNLLQRFGVKLTVGKEIAVEEFIHKGDKVEFMVMQKKSPKDGKVYSNILPDSVKPVK